MSLLLAALSHDSMRMQWSLGAACEEVPKLCFGLLRVCTPVAYLTALPPPPPDRLSSRVGRNVAAGMTGGIGYFLDEDGTFPTKVRVTHT